MINIAALEQKLTAPGSRELGFEDRALEEILALTSQNRFLPAAEKAQQLWQQGVYDVRTFGCYLFGAFLERGLGSLGVIFECIALALSENLAFLSPTRKRERHLDVSLRWLFDSIITQVSFHERQKDAVWKKWNEEWQLPVQQQGIDRLASLIKTLDQTLPEARCRGSLLHLQSLLESVAKVSAISARWDMTSATQIPAPPPPEEPAPPSDGENGESDSGSSHHGEGSEDEPRDEDSGDGSAEDPADDAEDAGDEPGRDDADNLEEQAEEGSGEESRRSRGADDADSSASARSGASSSESLGAPFALPSPSSASSFLPPSALPMSSQSTMLPGTAALSLPISPALQTLLQALSGFAQLVERKRDRHAAILLQEIRQTLQGFEPTRFFPTLFTDYLVALARHGARLQALQGNEDELETQALRQLCRADLGRFLSEGER